MPRKLISYIQVLLCICFLFSGCSTSDTNPDQNTNRQPTTSVDDIIKDDTTSNDKRYIDPIFNELDIQKDIVYRTAKNNLGIDQDLTLDLYEPKNDTEQNRPVIIWIHGGSLSTGSKNDELMVGLAERFAKKGYVTMSINYRLRATAELDYINALDNAVEDATYAIDWIKSNKEEYHINPELITVGGYSSGATVALALGYEEGNASQDLMAVISLAGEGISIDITRESPPCVIIHGSRDQTIYYYQSELISYQLAKQNVYYELYTLDADHSLGTYKDEIEDVTTKHLYYILTGTMVDIPIRTVTLSNEEKVYYAKQINLNVDGSLEEWNESERIMLNQLKDAGDNVPEKSDFTAQVMLGWNESDPNRIYLAAIISDDIAQYNQTEFWKNDSLEIMFNLLKDQEKDSVVRWILSTDGETLYPAATNDNTEWKVVHTGSEYVIEVAMDLTKSPEISPLAYRQFVAEKGKSIAVGIQFNDSENDTRETQVGWVFGPAWDQKTFGTFILE